MMYCIAATNEFQRTFKDKHRITHAVANTNFEGVNVKIIICIFVGLIMRLGVC